MSDVFSKAKRSEVMSRIRSTGNKDTEQKLAGLMQAAGITGWKRQVKVKVEKWRSGAVRCRDEGASTSG